MTVRVCAIDLTVTLPGTIGGELIKTAGHIHSSARRSWIPGDLRSRAWAGGVPAPVHRSAARHCRACIAGERILIPPGASHLTVNIGAEPLVVADLVAIDPKTITANSASDEAPRFTCCAKESAWTEQINPHYPHTPIWTVVEDRSSATFPPGAGPLYTDAIANLDDCTT